MTVGATPPLPYHIDAPSFTLERSAAGGGETSLSVVSAPGGTPRTEAKSHASDHWTVRFDRCLRAWVGAACAEWGWGAPTDAYYAEVNRRLPSGLRATIASGLVEGLVISDRWKFNLKGLPRHKGPYRWFSQRKWPDGPDGPHPNWEYFVQVAEFVRLYRVAVAEGLTLTADGSVPLPTDRHARIRRSH